MIYRFPLAFALVTALSLSSFTSVRAAHAQPISSALAVQSSLIAAQLKQSDEPTTPSPDAAAPAPSSDEETADGTDDATADDATADSATITDAELSQFADVLITLEALQNSYRAQSIAAVQEIGLSLERFDQILVLARSPEAEGADEIPEPTTEETEQFQQAVIQISLIQDDIQSQAQQAILDEGLSLERFQNISDAVNEDPTLEDQVRQFMEMSRPDPG
jgi:hypothetical protein